MVTDGITEARPTSILLLGQAARAHAGGELEDDAATVVFQCGVEATGEHS